ncbi:hypothetical protein DQ04_09881060 [Trypanosoma grayi]|uniref:hypothetical protein n=1 Tax=Trypanosoma grayi TaxID=71804 RepID=UPI0004F42278|nr:hypothetical protein DQ04_09881060 [Trypanosoma grayi]KEG07416.1 hypothetical protein DQ04_09881060 [Trypanosoma grayi]
MSKRKHPREVEESAKDSPSQFEHCGFGALAKVGLLSHICAKHRSSQKPPSVVEPLPKLCCTICQKATGSVGGMAILIRFKEPDGLSTVTQEPTTDTQRSLGRERVKVPALHGKATRQEKHDEALSHLPKRTRREASLSTEVLIKYKKKRATPPYCFTLKRTSTPTWSRTGGSCRPNPLSRVALM